MAPLAVYGVQAELGWWGKFGKPGTVHEFYVWIKGSWIFMEIAAVMAGVVALRFFRAPFIVSPSQGRSKVGAPNMSVPIQAKLCQ